MQGAQKPQSGNPRGVSEWVREKAAEMWKIRVSLGVWWRARVRRPERRGVTSGRISSMVNKPSFLFLLVSPPLYTSAEWKAATRAAAVCALCARRLIASLAIFCAFRTKVWVAKQKAFKERSWIHALRLCMERVKLPSGRDWCACADLLQIKCCFKWLQDEGLILEDCFYCDCLFVCFLDSALRFIEQVQCTWACLWTWWP